MKIEKLGRKGALDWIFEYLPWIILSAILIIAVYTLITRLTS